MRSRLLPLAAFGTLVVYLAIAIPLGLRNTALRLRAAIRTAGMPPAAVRARVFGPQYVAGIDRIRHAIPENEPYLLAEQGIPGAMLWVRFDLLPRRAVAVKPAQRSVKSGGGAADGAPGGSGSPGGPGAGGDPEACSSADLRWVVVAVATGRPPLLFERPAALPPGCPPAPVQARPQR